MLERAIITDFAFVRAHRADRLGNLQFRGGSHNFNVSFAKAARVTIAEADEIGAIPAEHVDLPGVFVTRVVASTTQMDVRNLPMRPSRPGGSARSYHGKPALTREQIARRVAALLPDGATVNLGAGLPALVANFLRERAVILHSENGMLNYGEFVHGSSFDPDLHDASGHFVTVRDGASFFDSVTSFEIARSGRLDAVVLGAYQVGANGDLANWSVPGMTGGGIGGAMLRRTGPGFRLEEIARGFSPDEVIGLTRMNVDVTGRVSIMQESWGAGESKCERCCLTRPARANEASTPRSLPACVACAG